MRTTFDIADDLLVVVRHLAHESGRSMGAVAEDLIRRGLDHGLSASTSVEVDELGLPTVSVGRVITSEDVRSLDDE